MVFGELISTLTGSHEREEKSKHPRNQLPFPGSAELKQGQVLLRDKLKILNDVKGQFPLFEAFTVPTTWPDIRAGAAGGEGGACDLTQLKALETQFNQELSAYSADYKLFMEEYQTIAKNMSACQTGCNTKYDKNEMKYQKGACLAGCTLEEANRVPARADKALYQSKHINKCDDLQTLGPNFCKQWVQTLDCEGHGPLDVDSIFKQESTGSGQCTTTIPSGASGYCICADGSKKGYVDCGHSPFTCNQVCQPGAGAFSYSAPSWPAPDYRKWSQAQCLGDPAGCFKAANPTGKLTVPAPSASPEDKTLKEMQMVAIAMKAEGLGELAAASHH